MQKYVNAYVSICVALNPQILYANTCFSFYVLSLYLTPGVARLSRWPNLGRGPKRLGNTGIQPWRRNGKCVQRDLCPVLHTIPSGNDVPPKTRLFLLLGFVLTLFSVASLYDVTLSRLFWCSPGGKKGKFRLYATVKGENICLIRHADSSHFNLLKPSGNFTYHQV
jgi:hypothetical protein